MNMGIVLMIAQFQMMMIKSALPLVPRIMHLYVDQMEKHMLTIVFLKESIVGIKRLLELILADVKRRTVSGINLKSWLIILI